MGTSTTELERRGGVQVCRCAGVQLISCQSAGVQVLMRKGEVPVLPKQVDGREAEDAPLPVLHGQAGQGVVQGNMVPGEGYQEQ